MAYATNRAAKRQYEILDTVRAGMELLGTEVKSIRNGKAVLTGARVLIRGGEAFLVGASVPPHQEKNNDPGYDRERTRRLLLNKKEIRYLWTRAEAGNLTLIPLTVYNCNRVLKLDIGIARKKNARDKRETIKKRDHERSVRRELKN